MKIDLRSDTFTVPTPSMLEFMFQAPVGDDVFGEDPSVNTLEEKIAGLFAMDAALFCPSGTMSNQIAVRVNTEPQDQVICDQRSHVYNYEGGGMAFNSLVTAKLVNGDRGRLSPQQILDCINPDDVHFPITKLVVLENTVNKGGGSYYTLQDVQAIREVAQAHHLRMHLDGARLFNALAETGESPAQWGALFDTISICLSKGLGAPVGSLLLGDRELIHKARRVRKVLGGGMRQAGYMAAAGIYALDHNISGLCEDNRRARELGQIVSSQSYVSRLHPVDTNILIFELDGVSPKTLLQQLAAENILALPFGGREVRMVTHLGITDEMVNRFDSVIRKIKL